MAAPPSGDLGRSRAIWGDLGRSRAISLSQVVDDEEFVRAVTVCALEAESPGCEVVTAENGEQGIAVYLERRHEEPPQFDLILMDIQMPVLTGDLVILSPHHPPPPAHPHPNHHHHQPPTTHQPEPTPPPPQAVKQLRTLERQHGWPQTCILARSANTADADQDYYRRCGMDGCIPKCGNVAKQAAFARTLRPPPSPAPRSTRAAAPWSSRQPRAAAAPFVRCSTRS